MSDEKISKEYKGYLKKNFPDACLKCGRKMQKNLLGKLVCSNCEKMR